MEQSGLTERWPLLIFTQFESSQESRSFARRARPSHTDTLILRANASAKALLYFLYFLLCVVDV